MTPAQGGGGRIDAHVDNLVNERSVQTLLLDLLQRVTAVETSVKLSDAQRTELINTTKQLSDRLGEVTGAIRTIDRLDKDVRELNGRLDTHDTLFAEARGGLKVARVFWSIIWGMIGGVCGLLVAWVRSRL